MNKFTTKYFGDFTVNENDEEIIIEPVTDITGETKEVSIVFFNVNTYFNKINTCIAILNEYDKLYAIGKEAIKNYKTNTKEVMEITDPPGVIFYKKDDEIKITLVYHYHDELNEILTVEMNEEYKIERIKYYE